MKFIQRLNPIKLIFYWLVIILVTTLMGMIFLSNSSSGGEQLPMTFLGEMLPIALYGVLIISVISSFLFKGQFKKYWLLNLLLIVISGYLLYINDRNNSNTHIDYGTADMRTIIGKDTLYYKKEYYNLDKEVLRSESYWKNGKKDSIWRVYAENGNIISEDIYKDDSLIRKSN